MADFRSVGIGSVGHYMPLDELTVVEFGLPFEMTLEEPDRIELTVNEPEELDMIVSEPHAIDVTVNQPDSLVVTVNQPDEIDLEIRN